MQLPAEHVIGVWTSDEEMTRYAFFDNADQLQKANAIMVLICIFLYIYYLNFAIEFIHVTNLPRLLQAFFLFRNFFLCSIPCCVDTLFLETSLHDVIARALYTIQMCILLIICIYIILKYVNTQTVRYVCVYICIYIYINI